VLSGLQDPVKKLIAISQLDSILKITVGITDAIDAIVAADVENNAE